MVRGGLLDRDTVTGTLRDVLPDGDELLSTASLRFGTEDQIRRTLSVACFTIDAVYGGWASRSVIPTGSSWSSPARGDLVPGARVSA